MHTKYATALFLILSICFSVNSKAQLPGDTINREHLNTALIEELFLKEINQLRASKSAPSLTPDNILERAAADQAAYCKKQDKVSHYQIDNNQKYDPKARIKYYDGNHGITGENALMTFLFQRYTDSKTQQQVTIYTYTQLAHQLFEQWKNSPEHYKNMIYQPYTNTGFALSLHDNKTVLYAVQVFASAQYTPPHNGLHYTDSTFGIAEHEPSKCKSYGQNDFLAEIFSSYLFVIGDSVYQYYQEEKTMHELISGPKDGIALDLVYKDQFSCIGPDHLHPSTVFDGYLLTPHYRDELFKNDIYKNEEFLSFVGKIPPNAPRKDMQINTVLIQNGMMCRYSFPVKVENGILPDIAINPKWCKIAGTIRKDSVKFEKEFLIPFKKNDKTTDSFYFEKLARLVKIYDGAITKIEITAYSSVEGTEANNLELQNARSTFIENFILKRLHQKTSIQKNAIENWDLFHKQIASSTYHDIFGDSISPKTREEVNARMTDPIVENWLNEQRVASIKLYVQKDFDDHITSNFLPLALYNSLEKEDTMQALIEYSRMIDAYQKGEIDKYFLTAIEVPLERQNLPLISNYLASILVESDIFSYHDFNPRYYIYIDSARKLFSDFKPLSFNLSVYKTHLYFRKLAIDVPAFQKIEADIQKFKKDTTVDKELQDHLMYNYYLTGSIFYKDAHMFPAMYSSFEKVKPYLSLASLEAGEVYEVARYFNYFFRFNETIDLLEKYLKKYPDNENLVYLYVSTGAIYNLNVHLHEDEYYRQLDKLSKMNHNRLCDWFNDNYQLIRDQDFKKRICGYCGLK